MEMIVLKAFLIVGGGGMLVNLVGVVRDIREAFELARLTRVAGRSRARVD